MANSVVNQVKVGSTTYDMKPYLGSATSGDAASATAWTSVDAITTSDSYDTVFNKVTKMVKNVRYLYGKLGTTDFSGISSTVSGALTTLNSGKSDTTHNHDSAYAAKTHSHSEYSLTTHTHSNYSTTGHTHSNYSTTGHNHDSAYAAKDHSHSNYSTTGHTHSNYSTTGHTHSEYSTTGHTHSYIATSNIVTSQTNSTSKVPAASLVYSMNTTLSSLNDASGGSFTTITPSMMGAETGWSVTSVNGKYNNLCFILTSFTIKSTSTTTGNPNNIFAAHFDIATCPVYNDATTYGFKSVESTIKYTTTGGTSANCTLYLRYASQGSTASGSQLSLLTRNSGSSSNSVAANQTYTWNVGLYFPAFKV